MPSYEKPLSVIDQALPSTPTTMWLAFETEDPEKALTAMRNGLARTVVQLPFLSGQIYEEEKENNLSKIIWSDDSPKLHFEEVDGTGLPSYQELYAQGFPLHKIDFDFMPASLRACAESREKPVFTASYTKLDGGLIVLIAPHHQLTDGGGREILVNLLAENARGVTESVYNVHPQEPLFRAERLPGILEAASKIEDSGIATKDSKMRMHDEEPASKTLGVKMSPSLNTTRLFRLSVRRLEALRKALAPHTKKPFSLNSMTGALLAALTSLARAARFRTEYPRFNSVNITSELRVAMNFRRNLVSAGLIEKNSWLGNMVYGPAIDVPFSSASSDTLNVEIAYDNNSSSSIPIPQFVPEVIDNITDGLAGTSPAGMAKTYLKLGAGAGAGGADFDFRTLRDMGSFFDGTNFSITNWGALDLMPDFGPGLGRPSLARVARGPGSGAYEGVALMLPRHRAPECGPERLDRFDIMLTLRTEDMRILEQDEALVALLTEPPI